MNVFAQIPADVSVNLSGDAKANSVLCGDAISETAQGCLGIRLDFESYSPLHP